MNKLRVAVIGAGHLGRIHARLLKDVEDFELIAVADPVEQSRSQAAAECGIEPVADYRNLLGRIDAAVVATPTRFHHAVGLDLLSHGIHLLVEKPLASTVAEAEQLVVQSRRRELTLQVGHVERFNPALAQVLPQLGEPKYIEAARCSGYSFRSTDIGVVLDLMIHDLDIVLSLVRSPLRSVEALGLSVLGGHEDVAQARLVFQNGCVANLTASRVSYQATRQMQIWSRRAFANLDFATRTATLVRPSEAVLNRDFRTDGLPPERVAHLKQHFFEEVLPLTKLECPASNAIADELRDFAASIRGGSPRVSGEDGRNAIAAAEAILAKIERHAWNGAAPGPIGPRLFEHEPILRGPHWGFTPDGSGHTSEVREAS